ncbi:MAG: hypothetical protein RIT28_5196 [Pseudomonadota bacterium]
MGLLRSELFKPTLFVGLGGNGGKIINQLAGRLRRHPHWDRIKALTHFLAIDTNKGDLDTLRDVSPDCRFLISNFDARAYVDRKRGRQELHEDKLVTQWFPEDYTPRSGETPGAGQIRIESRLKLYFNLEQDRARIRAKIRDMLSEMTRRDDPWRDNEDRCVRVMLYASVAGGTGSGGFLPFGYLLKEMVDEAGWGRAQVSAVLSMPTTFLDKVRKHLHKDIAANGYAALKELEHLNRQLAYRGGSDSLEFHYDPGALDESKRFVKTRPFAITYIIDRPDALSIEKYEHAIADASYLQIFSPLMGAQAGEYDNYEKHQRTLALGHFSTHYGSFGTALLQLPRRDILRYSARRYVARAFGEYLCFGGEHPDFRVPWGDPAFQRLDPEERNRRVDEKFVGYVAWRAQAEEAAEEKGVFTAVHNQTGKGGVGLRAGFAAKLGEIFGRLDELITLGDPAPTSISAGNPSVSNAVATLRREYAESRGKVRGQHLEATLGDLRSGRLLGGFFRELEVNPIAQRLFLIKLLSEPFITPTEDAADGEYLGAEAGPPLDLDAPELRQTQTRLDQELARAASPGVFSKVFDSENKAFNAAKRKALDQVRSWGEELRDDLRRGFWKTFEAELRQVAGAMLTSYRKVAEIADEQSRLLTAEAERFRRDPAAWPDSDIAQYYLDAEVLRDDRRRERLWNLLYDHQLDRGSFYDPAKIFAVVTEAFQPARDPDGRVRSRDAAEIVNVVKERLQGVAEGVFGQALEDMGLDLRTGLELEQRYVALLESGANWDELRRTSKLDDALRAIPKSRVLTGVEDRFKRLAAECVLLAHIDRSRGDDPTVVPADIFYAGLASQYASDESDSLGQLLKGAVAGLNFVPGWEERDSLVLYRALLGVPLYFYKNVRSELQPSYEAVYADPRREYPLHIEASWEKAPGLPNLDPVEMRRAEERRDAERAAAKAQSSRSDEVRGFTLCAMFGQVVRGEDGGWAWSFAGRQRPLGKDRAAAFVGFRSLDGELRADLESEAKDAWRRQGADRASKAKLAEDVRAHGRRLKELYADAVAEGRDAELAFLKEERAAVEALLLTVEG